MPKNKIIIGIDEVGRGALSGPVVVSGVIINSQLNSCHKIRDSKKLSDQCRRNLVYHIQKHYAYHIAESSVKEIDTLNILQATLLAMRRVIDKFDKCYDMIIVDGNQNPDVNNHRIFTMVQGDNQCMSIAAASIIAKVYRDDIMKRLHCIYPQYLWDKNKGYGTSKHIQAIKQYGKTICHRKKFISHL